MIREDGESAGDLNLWLQRIERALTDGVDMEVPCGPCSACCTSSQFVHIGPDETATLAAIPPELCFPAPGRPGSVVLGYDERGHCPMLVEGVCSIYAQRPRTCRTYDCRVFAATGTAPPPERPAIADRALRWRFDSQRPEGANISAALVDASGALVNRVPDPTTRALAALAIHRLFLDGAAPTVGEIDAELRARRPPAR